MSRKEPVKIQLKRRKKELASEKMQNKPNQDKGALGMLATAGIGAGIGLLGNTASQFIGRDNRNNKIDNFNQEQNDNEAYNTKIASQMKRAAELGLTSQNYSQAFKQIQPDKERETGFDFGSAFGSAAGGALIGASFGSEGTEGEREAKLKNKINKDNNRLNNNQNMSNRRINRINNRISGNKTDLSNLGNLNNNQSTTSETSITSDLFNSGFDMFNNNMNQEQEFYSYQLGNYGQLNNGNNVQSPLSPYVQSFEQGTSDLTQQGQNISPDQLIDIKGGNGQTDSIDAGQAFINDGETMKFPVVYSDSFKIDVELAAQNNLPAWAVGKTPSQISKVLDRKYKGSDRSAKNTKKLLFDSLDKASEMYRAAKQESEAVQVEQSQGQINPEMAQQMQQQMQQQNPQRLGLGPQDGSGNQQQISQQGLAYGGEIPPELQNNYIAKPSTTETIKNIPTETREYNSAFINPSDAIKENQLKNQTFLDYLNTGKINKTSTYEQRVNDANRREEYSKWSRENNLNKPSYDRGGNFNPYNPDGNMNKFNQYIPALAGYAGQALGPIYDLTREDRSLDYLTTPNTGINRQKYSPDFVNYNRSIDEANKSATQAQGSFNRIAGNSSTSAGQLLGNIGSNTRNINAKTTALKDRILEGESNTNTQISNKAKQFNATQANQDNRLDSQLKSKYDAMNYQISLENSKRNDKLASVNQLGLIGTTAAQDYLKNKSFKNNVGIAGTDEYGNLIDDAGNLIKWISPSAGAEMYTYSDGSKRFVLNGKEVTQKEYLKYIKNQ